MQYRAMALSILLLAGCRGASPSDAGADATLDDGAVVDTGAPGDGGVVTPVVCSLRCADADCVTDEVCAGPVRVVAANLTSGNRQSYDPAHGIRILVGLAGDVFVVQEMLYRDNRPDAIEAFVAQMCGPECSYHRGTGDLLPNGVVSRFPIIEAGQWDDPSTDTREFVWARIDIPGETDLWAVSLHLLTSSGADRETEARALAHFVDQSVPRGDHLILGGDFNVAQGPVFDILQDRVEIDPQPTDGHGNVNTNGPRSRRLDHVLASRALDDREVPVQIGAASYPGGLVVDTRVYQTIADLAPAEVGDSGAENMQHMAIVRDFAVQ